MVDALWAAHQLVKRGGLVIDARPDASRWPRVVAARRVRGRLVQSADADRRDGSADAAVETVVTRGLFRRTGERGVVWHDVRFVDLAELDDYLSEGGRYAGFEGATRRALRPFARGPLTMRRAIKFELLERR